MALIHLGSGRAESASSGLSRLGFELFLLLTSCLILGKSFLFSKSQFFHMLNRSDSIYLEGTK